MPGMVAMGHEEVRVDGLMDFHLALYYLGELKGGAVLSECGCQEGCIKLEKFNLCEDTASLGKSILKFVEQWSIDRGFSKMEIFTRHSSATYYEMLDYIIFNEEAPQVSDATSCHLIKNLC